MTLSGKTAVITGSNSGIGLGVAPQAFYAMLPFDVDYAPYTTSHVLTQMQLLVPIALVFAVALRYGMSTSPGKQITLEPDWIYRHALPRLIGHVATGVQTAWQHATQVQERWVKTIILRLYHTHGPQGRIARVWATGSMVQWIAVLLGVMLIVTFIS